MTDEEVIKKYNALVDRFGDKLPNFENYPNAFKQYVKLFNYYESRNDDQVEEQTLY